MGEESEPGLPGIAPKEDDRANTSGQDAAHAIPSIAELGITRDQSSQWPKPSPQQLKQILARHAGWLVKGRGERTLPLPFPDHDLYLESDPAYPEWRVEALSNPQKAILLYWRLYKANLRSANLRDADLKGAELVCADLSGATLAGVNLSGADLRLADLSGADLSDANLVGTDLSGAKLVSADLSEAKLSGANLFEADLSGAKLVSADLSGADLLRANLSGADLNYADLSGADLFRANLTSARLASANLTDAIYAPASEPPHPHLARLKGLSKVRVPPHDEVGLVQLRKLLQDAGLRDLEREATYSIERAKTTEIIAPFQNRPKTGTPSASFITRGLLSFFHVIFRLAAFDLTTAYGLHPFRALFLILAIWLLCVPIYSWSIARYPEQWEQGSGIYQVLPANRIDGPSAEPKIEKEPRVLRVQARNWWSAVPTAAYFSLLSAVNIGFQQFTPGDWIQRLQPHEYALRAEGWTRIVAGVQALLSVFLLAMWVLTLFGRPFQ